MELILLVLEIVVLFECTEIVRVGDVAKGNLFLFFFVFND